MMQLDSTLTQVGCGSLLIFGSLVVFENLCNYTNYHSHSDKVLCWWNKCERQYHRLPILILCIKHDISICILSMCLYNQLIMLITVSDGEGDAFRHALWNHRMTQKIGKSAAKKFGDAHEVGNLLEGTYGKINAGSSSMDLFNNNVGRNLNPIPGSK